MTVGSQTCQSSLKIILLMSAASLTRTRALCSSEMEAEDTTSSKTSLFSYNTYCPYYDCAGHSLVSEKPAEK